jgi:hypothetical protein
MADHLEAVLPAQSAGGATSVTLVGEVSATGGTDNFVQRVSVTSPSAVTGAATNNATINVRQLRAGSVVQTIATITLGNGTNLGAETPVAVPITGTPSTLQAGDTVDCQLVQNGTGLALPAGIEVNVDIA